MTVGGGRRDPRDPRRGPGRPRIPRSTPNIGRGETPEPASLIAPVESGRIWGRKIDEIKQNVPLDDARFNPITARP